MSVGLQVEAASQYGGYSTSPKQLEWVNNPGNPNQVEDEMEEHVIAHYLAAIQGYHLAKMAAFNNNDDGANTTDQDWRRWNGKLHD